MRVKKTSQDQRGVYRYLVDVPDGKGDYRRTLPKKAVAFFAKEID